MCVDLCRLLEELVPFMDHGIDDPKALSMPGSHHKRKQAAPQVSSSHAQDLSRPAYKGALSSYSE